MEEDNTCDTCKHYEWNIIDVGKNLRTCAGRCFCELNANGGNIEETFYKYGYEKCSMEPLYEKKEQERIENGCPKCGSAWELFCPPGYASPALPICSNPNCSYHGTNNSEEE